MYISSGSVSLALGFIPSAFFLDLFLRMGMYLCPNTDKNWNGCIFICANKTEAEYIFIKFNILFTFTI